MATVQQALWNNPLGTDGFAFVEFASPRPEQLTELFQRFGFTEVAHHRNRKLRLFRQGDINFIVNSDPGSHAMAFAEAHGPCVSAVGFRVENAATAYDHLTAEGAEPARMDEARPTLPIPAVTGVGGALLYLVDHNLETALYANGFAPLPGVDQHPVGIGLTYLDHLTHNVRRGRMVHWADFYERLFNFREIRYFDIEGKLTGLMSKAMTSPDGKIRIPINESADENSQIEEFLREYRGEGVQHIALGTDDICATVDALRANGVRLLDTPDAYYDRVDARVPGHGEDLEALRQRRILIDGAPTEGQGLLLQIFSETVIGPIFFEIIQRKGNEGFGEGNFKALFELVEEDQIRRGVLKA